jgi:hypothetical protein
MSDNPEITHWGGVIATAALVATNAKYIATYAQKHDRAGVEHELTQLLDDAHAIDRFLKQQPRER